MKITKDQLKDALDKAEKATFGPWCSVHIFAGEEVIAGGHHEQIGVAVAPRRDDASHIATMSPDFTISLITEHLKLLEKMEEAVGVIRFYADKDSWVDIYRGVLPQNLGKQTIIKPLDVDVTSKTPGYENECGGKISRAFLEKYKE